MTQKDNVKQLIGKSLNAYNNKVLQQIDRIEKKNKQQNHKISMLTNELDNDYLTKTEEGSVISLDHSKEGMVYIDSLEGNTLVNYCTDGTKELTLNGDIDLEGTFVTTTEGVDNGKVDVYCEGNTLVNLATVKSVTLSGVGSKNISNLTFKSNTKYTIIFDVDSNNVTNESHEGIYLWLTADGTNSSKVSALDLKGRKKYVMTRSDNVNGWGIGCRNNLSGTVILNNILILEGDWTDIETPPYFIGMKSVGQDDENGHKIEILSKNKNLTDIIPSNWEVGSIDGTSGQHVVNTKRIRTKNFMLLPKKQGSLNYKQFGNYKLAIRFYDKDYKMIDGTNAPYQGFIAQPKISIPNMAFYYKLVCANNNEVDIMPNEIVNNQCYLGIEEIPTSYIEPKLNKKEILINEPLRATENYKDRLVKINNKWFIERNCDVEVLDGTKYSFSYQNNTEPVKAFVLNGFTKRKRSEPFVIENYPCINSSIWSARTSIGLYNGTGDPCGLAINESELTSLDDTGVKEYLSRKLIRLVYAKDVPTYEPLEIEPTLNTYTDIAHISNNSIIPCNMKIKNTGYNAIIKPSTLYTVALDTNKSGTIGINLGGAKGTTTNNVATITTPATLTDDSLRLYGKGIKGSKVRLLEGDKTNWIPSHFEGMKSSFEDKFDVTDNTYKMEILSNNKNLIDIERMLNKDNYLKGTYSSIKIPLKPNTTYYFKCDFKPDNIQRWIGVFSEPLGYNGTLKKLLIWNDSSEGIKEGSFITDKSTDYYLSIYQPNVSYVDDTWYEELFTSVYNNFIISEVDKNYIEGKSNKIQFSSIEPLRSVGNTKDKFVFKNNKLMIERNIGEITIKDTILSTSKSSDTNRTYTTRFILDKKLFPNIKLQTGNTFKSDRFKHTSWSLDVEGFGIGSNLDFNILNIRLSSLDVKGLAEWFKNNPTKFAYILAEPTYEEIPFELQKIILEGYENGTLFFDTNIPPTSTITYAGETPIVKSVRLNKTEVSNNTNDINDNIIPYLMDMDYRVVCLQLESNVEGISMARLFGGTYEMLKRDIQSNRLTKEEYGYRLIDYFNAGKLTEEEVRELEDLK